MKKRTTFGAILLLAGTCIGAGMLALPVSIAPLGFIAGVILLLLAWCFMSYTGFLVVEANLWLPENTSYISMARKTLGKLGAAISWVAFLLLLYSLMSAYITGGGALVMSAAQQHGISVKPWESYLPWIIVFAVIIYLGSRFTDWINRLLMLGLIVSYATLAAVVTPHIQVQNLEAHIHWRYFLMALPILLASFGYHIVLPSMRDYLKSDLSHLRWMVLLGSLFPLVIYLIWILLILGVVPMQGEHGLISILHSGKPTDLLTHTLMTVAGSFWIGRAARFFAFFAIASSFVGVSLGLFDLLADGLNVRKSHLGRSLVAVITFVPPFLFAVSYPGGFLLALGYAGVFVAILHGILPAAMVWAGRYHLKLKGEYRVIGGKLALMLVFAVSILVIYAQIASH